MAGGPAQEQKGRAFRELHEGDPFVIPNPWDAGSARVLAALGFSALASTSGGFALTLGRADGEVSLDEVAAHTRALDEATALPVSVDLENGYGSEPESAAAAIAVAADHGAVGGSIEDYDPAERKIYGLEHATARVAAAAETARGLAFPFTLTARAENHFRGNPDIEDTIARLQAFEAAGADVLYAPGLRGDEIRAVRAETSKPLNVLAFPGLTMSEIADAGGTRVSVGSQLAWVAYAAMAEAAEAMEESGEFAALKAPMNLKRLLD